MKLLAIDTATEACSAALAIEGDILACFEIAPRRHTQLILPMCERLLAQAGITLSQLDTLAFGRGPGSFTGVRIAAAVIQGMAFAYDLPVAPVSTLAALAQEVLAASTESKVLAAIDARMNEVYWGYYTRSPDGLAYVQGIEGVARPAQLPILTGTWYGVGSGWCVYADAMMGRFGAYLSRYDGGLLPKARYLIPLAMAAYHRADTVSAEQALPVYLRDNVAIKSR
jgi:tRNA threonylcarbamoyladenosine biosynthesis protein TsaB